ncbi:MAG: hypothetical protein MJ016_04775 [Victivallaceae bacterium]|nr:hypothetical protein [Victivallaceae bacterium]
MNVQELPVGDAPKALGTPHFPAPFQAVVWRNWNRIHPARIAEVLETTEEKIVAAAGMMGLKRDDRALAAFKDRGFLTTIRYNWQLLDYDQMLKLLDWTPDRLEFTLVDDDFMFIKLGSVKPQCGKVVYRELSDDEKARTARIAETMKSVDASLSGKTEIPFEFLNHFGRLKKDAAPADDHLRMVFSYSAVYGDALLPEMSDPYPDELLADYAAVGVNAIWMPVILHQLIPWLGKDMPLSARCDERLAKLKIIAARAKKHGIRLILYLNEPRAIPARIKIEHEEWRSALHGPTQTLSFCPWAEGMLDALSGAIETLCREVPELGGFFTITMSENVTHCLARECDQSFEGEMETHCPVCAKHSQPENVVAVMNSIRSGMKRAGADDMRLIAYTWAWLPEWDQKILEGLPPDVIIMSVSEANMETDVEGFKSRTCDYSISKVGPGDQAKRMWRNALAAGHDVAAKIQVNTSWEMGGVPAIPVPTLVEEHLQKLRAGGIKNFMLNWTVGGYPGGNLELLVRSCREIAERDYGDAAPQILQIWREFGEAFRKLPFNFYYTLYYSPINVGPANLLYPVKTGYHSGMVCGIPYDDIDLWCTDANYPHDVYERRFRILSEEWCAALEKLRALGKTLPPSSQAAFTDLWNRAEATYCSLRSTYCQIAFINLRDAGKLAETKPVITEEIELAQRLLAVVKADSRIGFEAANHYFYGENELREKIVACRDLLETLPL